MDGYEGEVNRGDFFWTNKIVTNRGLFKIDVINVRQNSIIFIINTNCHLNTRFKSHESHMSQNANGTKTLHSMMSLLASAGEFPLGHFLVVQFLKS